MLTERHWNGRRMTHFSDVDTGCTLKTSAAVRQKASAVYTSMHWIVRRMTHFIDVNTGFTLKTSAAVRRLDGLVTGAGVVEHVAHGRHARHVP